MIKPFDERNSTKQEIHALSHPDDMIINTKEVWFVVLWCNIWYEEDGKVNFLRPVLVIRRIWALYFCIPLTTKVKQWIYYYTFEENIAWKISTLMLSQGRVLDKRRFRYQIGKIEHEEFNHIKKLLKDMYLWEVS